MFRYLIIIYYKRISFTASLRCNKYAFALNGKNLAASNIYFVRGTGDNVIILTSIPLIIAFK